jgi:hypothetical protein
MLPYVVGSGRHNDQLRRARCQTPSPADAERTMSRHELAEAVNAHVFRATGQVTAMDAHYVGRLERGLRRWPSVAYRDAFRAVLGASTDSALGFRPSDRENRGPALQRGPLRTKVETIRFASRNDDETYFYRAVHQLGAGCVLLNARDHAVTALLAVLSRAVADCQRQQGQPDARQQPGADPPASPITPVDMAGPRSMPISGAPEGSAHSHTSGVEDHAVTLKWARSAIEPQPRVGGAGRI